MKSCDFRENRWLSKTRQIYICLYFLIFSSQLPDCQQQGANAHQQTQQPVRTATVATTTTATTIQRQASAVRSAEKLQNDKPRQSQRKPAEVVRQPADGSRRPAEQRQRVRECLLAGGHPRADQTGAASLPAEWWRCDRKWGRGWEEQQWGEQQQKREAQRIDERRTRWVCWAFWSSMKGKWELLSFLFWGGGLRWVIVWRSARSEALP